MVCMNKLFNQQYFKYLYKSNRRLLILIWAILFICICFFTTIFTINDFTAYSEVQTFVTAMSGFCGISISMFVPIYFFRFLYRKRSCDLYFGLPIRKKELFSTTFLFGYLAILIPIAVYFLSTSIIASQFMNVLSSTILMNIKVMGFFAIFMLCIQAIICFLCIRCNTMMDALFISGTYVILPFILYISMNIFLKEQVNVISTVPEPPEPLLDLIDQILDDVDWVGTATELLQKLQKVDVGIIYTPNTLSRKLNHLTGRLGREKGILYFKSRRSEERSITLLRKENDDNDDKSTVVKTSSLPSLSKKSVPEIKSE